MKFLSKCLFINNYLIFNFLKYKYCFIVLNFNFKLFILKKNIIFKKKIICITNFNLKKKFNLYGKY
ncbi:MAG: hypothetical protein NVS84_00835 [Candidatus Carsonella ruddii]|nr:MAG: hypothetical protein NVS84_00835 [Candidatus Carsonella ruddii]WMC19409.1 MAG: hypothetical protein NVS85_00835 [Candidatus Carsonella ruddii]